MDFDTPLDPDRIRAAYERDGFIVVRNLLRIDLLREVESHFREKILPAREQNVPVSEQIQTLWDRRGLIKMIKANRLVETEEPFRRLATDPELVDVVEMLLGAGAKRFRDVLVMKPASTGGALSYHQDSAYWDVAPKSLVSAWIPLRDVVVDASALQVVPGSHHAEVEHGLWIRGELRVPRPIVRGLRRLVSLAGTGDQPGTAGGNLALWNLKRLVLAQATRRLPILGDLQDYRVPPGAVPAERELRLPVAAGDVVLFHSLLLHASGANETAVDRLALIASFMPRHARFVGVGTPSFPDAREREP